VGALLGARNELSGMVSAKYKLPRPPGLESLASCVLEEAWKAYFHPSSTPGEELPRTNVGNKTSRMPVE
jgi:hypothetical protein